MSENPFASDENPYLAPNIVTSAGDAIGGDPGLDRAADMLRQTKPWVRFVSVILFILAALMVLVGLAVMVGGMMGPMGPSGAVFGAIYILMAILYIAPGIFLWAYADRIGIFLRQRTPGRLAMALESQKSFWKFTGIVTLIVLCIYGLALLAFVCLPIVMQAR